MKKPVTKYFIVGRRKGNDETYYVSSITQGERMIPWAYSMATTFTNKGIAIKKRQQLQPHYKGLQLSVRKYEPDNSDSYAFGPYNSEYA